MNEPREALSNIEQAREWMETTIRAGRVAHAYLLRASTIEEGVAFAEYLLERLFDPDGKDPSVGARIREHAHPDVAWVEPESKRRIIRMEQMRALIRRISQTSYAGGWKAGVIRDADRLNDESANAFLKTLEEPAGQTVLLLVTCSPEALPATIRSRCQQVNLSRGTPQADGPWRETLLGHLRRGQPTDMLHVMQISAGLLGLLEEEQRRVEEETTLPDTEAGKAAVEAHEARISAKVLQVRHAILQCVQQWHRDVLLCVLDADPGELNFPGEIETLRRQAANLDYGRALRILDEVDGMSRRLERVAQSDDMVFNVGVARQAAVAQGAE